MCRSPPTPVTFSGLARHRGKSWIRHGASTSAPPPLFPPPPPPPPLTCPRSAAVKVLIGRKNSYSYV